MSFDTIRYGDYGDEKVTSTSKIGGLPLGTKMELPDGRVFRHAKVGAAALVAGKVYQGKAVEANTIFHSTVAPNSAAVGAKSVTITVAGTALGAGVYDDGYLITASSVGTGIGYLYKVKTAATCAADSTSVVTLADNDSIAVALQSGTTKVGMRKNQYSDIILTTGDTVGVNTIVGVACATAAISSYCWIQRRGPAAVFTDATTPIVGIPVVASSSVNGAIATPTLTGTAVNAISTSKMALPLGICMTVAGEQFSLIDLTLE